MAADLQETPVTYEELADLELEFEDVETEIIRHQVQLTQPLYEKRQKIVAQIPNFWPLVLEQAPPDIDEYIQPSDSALLLSCLKSLSVARFEIESGGKGDPRSVAIKWEFSENEYFEDSVLEKKFWYRRAEDGWAGLVSEPVNIRWKKDKDLTAGLLDMVKRVWDEEQTAEKPGKGDSKTKNKELTPLQKELKQKIEETGLGGLSFFAWFGYRGRQISAEESRVAIEKEQQKRKLRLEGKKVEASAEDNAEDEEEEDDEWEALEIFPEGDTLAVTIAEDLWPGAIKYFTQAQEQDTLSDLEFESDMEMEGLEEDSDAERPSKKRKA